MYKFLLQNGALWDMEQGHFGICATGEIIGIIRLKCGQRSKKAIRGLSKANGIQSCIHFVVIDVDVWNNR